MAKKLASNQSCPQATKLYKKHYLIQVQTFISLEKVRCMKSQATTFLSGGLQRDICSKMHHVRNLIFTAMVWGCPDPIHNTEDNTSYLDSACDVTSEICRFQGDSENRLNATWLLQFQIFISQHSMKNWRNEAYKSGVKREYAIKRNWAFWWYVWACTPTTQGLSPHRRVLFFF